MKRKFGVDAELHPPKIPYRETITGHRPRRPQIQEAVRRIRPVRRRHHRDRQPLPRGGGFEGEDKIFGGSIPHQFRPSVEKGVRQTMEQGAVTGNP